MVNHNSPSPHIRINSGWVKKLFHFGSLPKTGVISAPWRGTEWMMERLEWMFQHHGQRHRGHACCVSEQPSIYHKVSLLRFTYTHIRPHNKQPFQPFHIPPYSTFNPQLKSPMLALKQTEHLTIFLIASLSLPGNYITNYSNSLIQIIKVNVPLIRLWPETLTLLGHDCPVPV